MKKLILLVAVLVSIIPMEVMAQGISINMETEAGNGGGEGNPGWFHQYFFANVDIGDGTVGGVNLLTRFFWVGDGILTRGEVAVGPTFYSDSVLKMIQLQFGGTTDSQVMAATLVVAEVAGHDIVYVGDRKFRSEERLGTFYQKLFVSIDTDGDWHLRADHLLVGREGAFFRVGPEFRYGLNDHHHLFVSPFWDLITNRPGIQLGYRF